MFVMVPNCLPADHFNVIWPRVICSILIGIFLIFTESHACQASDLISQRAYWEDPSTLATFEQAKAQTYTNYSGLLARGFTHSAHWIKLRIEPLPEGSQDTTVVLRIRPVYIDHIELYDPLSAKPDQPSLSGSYTRFNKAELASLSYTFVIARHDSPRDVFLRIASAHSSLMYVEAMPNHDFYFAEWRQNTYYAIHLSTQIFLYIWVLISWLPFRDRLGGNFLMKQAVMILHTFCIFGYHRLVFDEILDPQTLEAIFLYLSVIVLPLAAYYEYRFLKDYDFPIVFEWGQRAIIFCSLANIVLIAFGYTRLALQSNSLEIAAITLWLALTATFIRQSSATKRQIFGIRKRWIVAYYYLIALALGVNVLANSGIFAASILPLYTYVMYSTISGVLMTILIQYRFKKMGEENRNLIQSTVLLDVRAGKERELREEQERLMSMLSHEIRTPLATIRMAIKSKSLERNIGAIERAVIGVDTVVERTLQMGRLEGRKYELERIRLDLAEQVISAGVSCNAPKRIKTNGAVPDNSKKGLLRVSCARAVSASINKIDC